MIAIALFLTVFIGYTFYNQFVTDNNQVMHCEVVDLQGGYGYQILKGEKTLILQEYIPGLPGKQLFATKNQALSVANLVLEKIENGESPVLEPSDLSKLNISITDNY